MSTPGGRFAWHTVLLAANRPENRHHRGSLWCVRSETQERLQAVGGQIRSLEPFVSDAAKVVRVRKARVGVHTSVERERGLGKVAPAGVCKPKLALHERLRRVGIGRSRRTL